ncbi:MAG TPA: hypothetical protein VEZ90_17800, partial [Blastocatellia bacterium]|nr:hypothetical protein [Blastocatellia bacterium]
MPRSRSSISKSHSYDEIGNFWDTRDLADYWDQTSPADFEVEIDSQAIYYPVERDIAATISSAAKTKGQLPRHPPEPVAPRTNRARETAQLAVVKHRRRLTGAVSKL